MESETRQSLQGERYITIKALDKLSVLYGDRGKLFVGMYAYLRWIDDIIDKAPGYKEEKLSFLDRELQIVAGDIPDDLVGNEKAYLNLPWGVVKVNVEQVKLETKIVLHSIIDDVEHQDLKPRNSTEQRHYNWRTLHPCINIANLIINGKTLKATREMMDLLEAWNGTGGLIDLVDDINNGMALAHFSEDELRNINDQPDSSLRKSMILEIYDQDRYKKEMNKLIQVMVKNGTSFFKADMPFWQRCAIVFYMFGRAPIKATVKGAKTMGLLSD